MKTIHHDDDRPISTVRAEEEFKETPMDDDDDLPNGEPLYDM